VFAVGEISALEPATRLFRKAGNPEGIEPSLSDLTGLVNNGRRIITFVTYHRF
jgi:hypothetical protein